MRRYLFIISLLLSANCMGQDFTPTRDVEATDDGIIVTYRFNGGLQQDDPLHPGAKFWKIPGFALNDVAGQPAFPFHWDTFVIPDDCEVNVELIDSTYSDIPFTMAPAYPPLLMSDTIGYTTGRVPNITNYSGWMPRSAVMKGDLLNYRGQGLVKVAVTPSQYRCNHTLRAFSMIQYKVSFTRNGARVRGRDYVSNSADSNISLTDHFLENTTLNYALSQNGRQNVRRRNAGTRTESEAQPDNRGYLIITTDNFLDAVNEFAEWKRTKGFTVIIISRTNGEWTSASVNSIIAEAYRNIHNRYLLLVGDADYIPSNPMSFQLNESNTYYFSTDFPYTCPDGQFDFVPDILAGRISVKTNQEARAVFEKIISYEKSPVQDADFYNNFTCCSYFQDTNYNPSTHSFGDGYEDSRATLTSEEIKSYLSLFGKLGSRIYCKSNKQLLPLGWNNTIYYDGSPLSNELLTNAIWNGDSTKIKTAINNGTFFLSYIGHGGLSEWCEPYFNGQNISSLSNGNKFPIVYSMSCNTGRFNFGSDCLAESFLKKEDGGAVAVIAPSLDTLFGYTEMLDEYCVDAIWPNPGLNVKWMYDEDTIASPHLPVYEMGEILNQAFERISNFNLTNTYSISPPDTIGFMGYYQLTRNTFHLFGDPSMRIYTTTPIEISKPVISFSDGVITVATTDGDARISFYNKSFPSSVSSYIGSYVDYSFTSDSVTICIDRHNCIPYIVEVKRSDFIQNETIEDNRIYVNSSVLKIGNSVTTTKPVGDVIINGGNITIKGNTVELHPGTTIMNSNVEINPQ